MHLTIQNILLVLAVSCAGTGYLVAGVIACDRFSDKSPKINNLLTNNEFCFAFTVFLWPLVGALGALYFRVIERFQVVDK